MSERSREFENLERSDSHGGSRFFGFGFDINEEDLEYIVDVMIDKTRLNEKIDYILVSVGEYIVWRFDKVAGVMEAEAKARRQEVSYAVSLLIVGLATLFSLGFGVYLMSLGQVNAGKSFMYPAVFGVITMAWMFFKRH